MTQKKGKFSSMMRPISVLLLCLAALPAFAYSPPAASELDASAESFLMRAGVVVDPARGALYVMSKEGVVAQTLDGAALWQSEAAMRPVGLFGDQLIALAAPTAPGSAQIVFLDVRSGEALSAITAPLTGGAGGWVVDRPHQSFTATTLVVGGEIFFSWSFTGRPLQGAPVVAGEPVNQPRTSAGVLSLDPLNRLASVVDAAAAPRAAAWRFDLSAEESLIGVAGRQFRAPDDRHILASEKAGDDDFNRYRWTILDRADARVLGAIDRPVSTAAFFVNGATLVHESTPYMRRLPSGEFEAYGLRLIGVDLGSQRQLWSLDIRDTAYHGRMAP